MKKTIFYLILFPVFMLSQNWQEVDKGTDEAILTLFPYNNGLIAGGYFWVAGNQNVYHIAFYDGKNWTALGEGFDGSYTYSRAFAEYHSELYIGGNFTLSKGGDTLNFITKWDGNNYVSLGDGANNKVIDMVVFNNELYIAGKFTEMDGKNIKYIAKWDGLSWDSLNTYGFDNYVTSLEVYNNELYAGGFFTQIGMDSVHYIARWDGNKWNGVGNGMNGALRTLVTDTVNDVLYAGGFFTTAGNITANRIAYWDNVQWNTLGDGADSIVMTILPYGNEVYMGGYFSGSGTTLLNYISKWNGSEWVSLDGGMDHNVYHLAMYKDTLFVGGQFSTAGSTPVSYVAKWMNNTTFVSPNLKSAGIMLFDNSSNNIRVVNNDLTENLSMEVFSIDGRLVYTESVLRQEKLNVDFLANGSYIAVLKNRDEFIQELKFIKKSL